MRRGAKIHHPFRPSDEGPSSSTPRVFRTRATAKHDYILMRKTKTESTHRALRKSPGVFMTFEETAEELTRNVIGLGYDLKDLIARKLLLLDHVHVERGEFEETEDLRRVANGACP